MPLRSIDTSPPAPSRALAARPDPAAITPPPVGDRSANTGLTVFRYSIALYIVVTVARVHEVIPGAAYLRPGKLLVIPLLASALLALPRWQVFAPLRATTTRAVGVIIVLGALSAPLAIWPSNSVFFLAQVLLPLLLLFLGAAIAFVDRKAARLCILALVVGVAIDALFLLAGLTPQMAGRAYIGIGLDPNESAALFVLATPWAITLSSRGTRGRWLGLATAAVLAAAVVKTGSRGGVISFAIVALALIARANPRHRLTYLVGTAACGVGFALAADDALIERMSTIASPRADYNITDREGRIQVWSRGLGYMATHPVLGIGLDNFEIAEGVLSGKVNRGYGIRYTAAHNAFVQIGAELGVLGLSAFVVAFWSAARGCRRVLRAVKLDRSGHPRMAAEEGQLASAAFCALLGVATSGLFLSLAYHPITLLAFAVCIGVYVGSPYARRFALR